MNRYLVFAWPMTYECGGGWSDFHSSHEHLREAELARLAVHSKHGGSHVVDLDKGEIVISQYEEYEPRNEGDNHE